MIKFSSKEFLTVEEIIERHPPPSFVFELQEIADKNGFNGVYSAIILWGTEVNQHINYYKGKLSLYDYVSCKMNLLLETQIGHYNKYPRDLNDTTQYGRIMKWQNK